MAYYALDMYVEVCVRKNNIIIKIYVAIPRWRISWLQNGCSPMLACRKPPRCNYSNHMRNACAKREPKFTEMLKS